MLPAKVVPLGSDPIYLIALDWGTTSLRAYLIARDGRVIEERAAGKGIMQVEDGRFADALSALCGDWLSAHPTATLIASGMIGSKQGWIEAPYCPCPANAAALATKMVPINTGIHTGANATSGASITKPRQLHIAPGVSFTDPLSGVPDVMRGEETQIIGAIPATGAHLVVLPGTHSKWAWLEDGAIVHFSSWMTGEVYAALTQHTILGRLMKLDAAHDAAAFARGVHYGLENPGQLLSRVFSARTLGLFDALTGSALPSYLSGLLIGTEIGAATGGKHDLPPAILLGSPLLVQRYQSAFDAAGLRATAGPEHCAAQGLHRLAQAL